MIRCQRQFTPVWALMFLGSLGFSARAQALEFAGGTGTADDPYQIATAEQLLAIGKDKDLRQRHFILVDTIDLSDIAVPTYAIPSQFTGSFDGDGYTIENLGTIDARSSGLFAYIWIGGEVKNLGVVNANIKGAGALANLNMGSVQNCYSTGTVAYSSSAGGGLLGTNLGTVADSYSSANVFGQKIVGGLVGGNSGTLSRCYSTGRVAGDVNTVGGLAGSNGGEISACYSTSRVSCPSVVGGLLGRNVGVLSDCYSSGKATGDVNDYTGEVIEDANDIGGLVGFNYGRIASCYSTSPVVGKKFVGGLVGTNTGEIASCYADANLVSEGAYVGGLVGDNWAGSIESCYSIGVLAGTDYVGGLVGHSDSEATITTSYSVAQIMAPADSVYAGGLVGDGTAYSSYFLDPTDGGGRDNGIGIPLTDAEMKLQSSFVGWDFSETSDDEAGLWFMPEDAYPILIWQTEITDPNVAATVPDGA